MGLSFHEKESTVEATSGLRFGSIDNPETELPTLSFEFQRQEVLPVLSTFPIQSQKREIPALRGVKFEAGSMSTTSSLDYMNTVISLPSKSQSSNIIRKQTAPVDTISLASRASDIKWARPCTGVMTPPSRSFARETSHMIFLSLVHSSALPSPPPPAYLWALACPETGASP